MVTQITTTPAEDALIAPAMGVKLNLFAADGTTPRNATAAEVKKFLLDYLRLTVFETRQAIQSAQAKATVALNDINPS
jgi:hypothetical protein